MYSVRLHDGTIINAKLNGNNFIPEALDKSVFVGNLDTVTITGNDGNIEELHNQMIQFAKIGSKETFILSDKPKDETERDVLMLALAQLDMQREIDKTETQLALAELATMAMGGSL